MPGDNVPNTTVSIPVSELPSGTTVEVTEGAGFLSDFLKEAHRELIRPEEWSVKRFANALKKIVGWD